MKLIGISGQGICEMKNLTPAAIPAAAIVGVWMIAAFDRMISTSVAFGLTAPAMIPVSTAARPADQRNSACAPAEER